MDMLNSLWPPERGDFTEYWSRYDRKSRSEFIRLKPNDTIILEHEEFYIVRDSSYIPIEGEVDHDEEG